MFWVLHACDAAAAFHQQAEHCRVKVFCVQSVGQECTCSQVGHRSRMSRGLSIKLWLVSRAVQYSSASMQQCIVGPSPTGTASGLSACCRSSCAHLHRQLGCSLGGKPYMTSPLYSLGTCVQSGGGWEGGRRERKGLCARTQMSSEWYKM